MSKKLGLWLMLFLLVFGEATVFAQQSGGATTPPPKVLVITREFLKPGKAGSPHEKTESMFANAFAAAKWPVHYLALDSLTGKPRMLFFTGYPTFEAWQADSMAMQKNATLAAAVDRAAIADGDVLESIETSVFVYREDMSHNAGVDIPHMRYMEISMFNVRPGHEAEWHALVKTYQEGFKDIPDTRWAMYQINYGQSTGSTFLVITPMKSASEIDKGFGDSKKFMTALGAEGMKKLGEQAAACIESSQNNLFMFNPKLSYVSDEWKKADSFWQTKSAAPMKKMEAKPKP
ncbi:MAG TPA: hypothetical protein VF135_13635 [Terriglobales bacterium]